MSNVNPLPPLIIVGVDGSQPSIAALGYAKRAAEAAHARLRAVSVWTYPISYSPIPIEWSPEAGAADQLADASRTVFGEILPEWYEQVVREGSAAGNLIEESAGADLLIVGSRGHGGFAGLLLGSVSSQCAGHTTCPVIIVHGDEAPRADNAPIIVGHDGSSNADEALVWALRTAQLSSAPVEVVRTWSIDRIPRQFTEEFGYVSSFDEVTARVRRDLIAETRSIVDSYPDVTVTLRSALAQPAEELITRSSEARMLVVGSRGHGGFAGLILGSVSSECAAHAHCPVMVVPKVSSRE